MKRFYFNASDNDDGEDYSLMIDAEDVPAATLLYKAYCETEWEIGFTRLNVRVIWELPPLSETPRAQVWRDDVTCHMPLVFEAL
jgi:hypothetical protein